MALTLEDIMGMPVDAEKLNKHLMDRGLIQPPAAAPPMVPPAVVSPLSPVAPRNSVAEMEAPNIRKGPNAPDWTALDVAATGHPRVPGAQIENFAAPNLAGPAMATPEGSMGVTPMTPPALTHQEKMALPQLSPGAPGVGTAAYTENQLAREEEARLHPWGTAENHPGLLGKIGHVAAKVGNIAGDIVAPGTMANIPGTELNRQMREGALKEELTRRTGAEEQYKNQELQRENLRSEIEQRGEPKVPTGAEETTLHDLMAGDNGKPRINPDTKQPYSYLEAFEATKQAGQKPAAISEGEKPLGNKVAQLNAGLTSRFQVLNPDKPLPSEFTLGADATQKDYDRIDKQMIGTESARATKAQQEAIGTQRAQAAEDRKEAKAEKKESEERNWVTGEDPNTHEQVMVPISQAKQAGLLNQAKADNDTINKTLAARHVQPLLWNDKPENPGIMQMIDKLDKNGKLGPLASKWNAFMAREWGSGDPDYAALLTRMDLASTKLMQAHVGSRGSAQMLEHFADLANAKKLDARTLKAGVDQEIRYVHDISMNAPKTKVGSAGAEKKENSAEKPTEPPREPRPGLMWQRNKNTGEYREVPEKK